MINTRLAAASMALAIALVPLVAEASHIKGAGAFTCGDRLSKSGRLAQADYQFAYGYLSELASRDATFDQNFRNVKFEALDSALDSYCQRNPLSPVVKGVQDLYHQLGGTLVWVPE